MASSWLFSMPPSLTLRQKLDAVGPADVEPTAPDVEALLEEVGDAYNWTIIPYGNHGMACLAIVTTDVEFTLNSLLERLQARSTLNLGELVWLSRHAEQVETARNRWLAWPTLTAVDLDEEAPKVKHSHGVLQSLDPLTPFYHVDPAKAYQEELHQLEEDYQKRKADLEAAYNDARVKLYAKYGNAVVGNPTMSQHTWSPVVEPWDWGRWPAQPAQQAYVEFQLGQPEESRPTTDAERARQEQQRRQEQDEELRQTSRGVEKLKAALSQPRKRKP